MEHVFNILKPKWILYSDLNGEQLDILSRYKETKKIPLSGRPYEKNPNVYNKNNNSVPLIQCLSKPNDVALILTSSGSTGLPKGVLITNNNLIFALQNR